MLSDDDKAKLMNAPPRLSDLPLAERRRAVVERYEDSTAQWWANREYRSPVSRFLDRLFGGE